jgi:EAL domain-containing protein (putative c-di-GMP-specific phosphodiesterase class I)
VGVNIGALQLQQKNFTNQLAQILSCHPEVEPHLLQLEVMETIVFTDLEQVSSIIQACLNMGVRFALDYFGKGYSSFSSLKLLPAISIKIDQSFIAKMLTDLNDRAMVKVL